jgi:hypothetical protein
MNFIDKFVKNFESSSNNLYLVKATDDGLDCWHYLKPDKTKLPLLKAAMKNAPCKIELTQFGKVIYSGWGEEPKPEVRKQIEDGNYIPEEKTSDYKFMYLENEQDGKPFYAIVKVKWELAEKFEYVANFKGNMNFEEWGEVVETGWGWKN